MVENPNPYVIFKKPKSENKPPTFYLEAVIDCERDVEAMLLAGSDGRLKAWLNGKVISIGTTRRTWYETYNNCGRISLKAGRNHLLFKIISSRGSCGLVAELVPDKAMLIGTVLKKNRSFLSTLILSKGTTLQVAPQSILSGIPMSASISDFNGAILARLSRETTLNLEPAFTTQRQSLIIKK